MRILAFILFLVVVVACEKESTWKPNIKPLNTIVVDAILTNENIQHYIKLSFTLDSMNASPKPVVGALVSVFDGHDTIVFNESILNRGSYYSQPFQAVVGKTYYLEIKNENVIYTAQTYMVPLVTRDSFEIIAENNLYKYVQRNEGETQMIEVTYNWSVVTEYSNTMGGSEAKEFFYILRNVDVNKEFGSEREIIYFPKGTSIIRKKYSLTEDHQAFLRTLLMETDWRGGVFDVQPGNVLTNISNGGLGYFAACTVVVDSFLVK
jgi:hypothetical protein